MNKWFTLLNTLKEWANLSPAGDAPFAGELAKCSLQKKHRDSTREEKNEVWNEKCTWK